MSTRWSFRNPVAVTFGAGCLPEAMERLPYQRLLLVTTPGMTRRGRTGWLQGLVGTKISAVFDGVTPNPTMTALDALAVARRAGNHDGIVAFGGGSTVDTGKVLAVLLGAPSGFSLAGHFLRGQASPSSPALPVVAIPTTSGTGSEVTPFATVWDDQAHRKYSLTTPEMFPKRALLDPELTHDLPWEVTLATALDALCQAFESIWNRNANPMTMSYATRAAELAWLALGQGEKLMTTPPLRSVMMEASLLAGLAISGTRTALCHSMSYPLTVRFSLPHGLACGFTMAAVLRYNAVVDDGRLARLARTLELKDIDSLAAALDELLHRLGVPGLVRRYCHDVDAVLASCEEMLTVGRADNNMRPAGIEDVRGLIGTSLRGASIP